MSAAEIHPQNVGVYQMLPGVINNGRPVWKHDAFNTFLYFILVVSKKEKIHYFRHKFPKKWTCRVPTMSLGAVNGNQIQ